MAATCDIFDENGEMIGQAPKVLVHRQGLWHKAVHIWIINEKDELLIQKRGPDVAAYPNLWDISAAGHIDSGENSVTAAKRETREELGINNVDQLEFRFLFSFKDSFTINNGRYINNEFDYVYLVTIDSSGMEFHLQKAELSEIKWVNTKQLKELIMQQPEQFTPRQYEYQRLFSILLSTP